MTQSYASCQAQCVTGGGNLALITSDAENTLAVSACMLGGYGAPCTIGTTDQASEGTWVNVDGTSTSYFSW